MSRLSTTTIWEMSVTSTQDPVENNTVTNTDRNSSMADARCRPPTSVCSTKNHLADPNESLGDENLTTDEAQSNDEGNADLEQQSEDDSVTQHIVHKSASSRKIHVGSVEPEADSEGRQSEESSDTEVLNDHEVYIDKTATDDENPSINLDDDGPLAKGQKSGKICQTCLQTTEPGQRYMQGTKRKVRSQRLFVEGPVLRWLGKDGRTPTENQNREKERRTRADGDSERGEITPSGIGTST